MATAPAHPPAPALRERLALWAVLAGALLVRAWHLGARSLWTDEGSTWSAATAPLHELIRLCAEKDASPPLFYLLTAGAMKLGDTEAHLRLVSLLASLALVWLTYRLARLVAGRAHATLAAALTALSPYQLLYAQEARTYMLVGTLTVWALYLFARAVVLDRRRAWAPFVLASALALYTQSIAGLGLGVQGACVALLPEARRRWRPWLLAQAAAFALYLPWLLVMLAQAARLSHSHWYVSAPDAHGSFQVLRAVFLAPVPLLGGAADPGFAARALRASAQLALVLLPSVPLGFAAMAILLRDSGGAVSRLVLAGLLIPLAAVFVVSFKIPLWLSRYFVLLTPMLAVTLVIGLAAMPWPVLRRSWTALLLLVGAFGCLRVDRVYTKEPWRDVVRHIAAESPPGRTAALVTFDLDPFRFYNRRQPSPVAAFEVSHPEVPFASDYTPLQLEQLERAAREHTAPFDEVWVVVRSPNSAARREVAARAEHAASEGRMLVGREFWDSTGGPLRVARFRRAAGDSTRRTPPEPGLRRGA